MNQKNVYTTLNISRIMKLEPLELDWVYATPDQDLNLTRKNILNKLVMVIASYFCIGTELWFLKELKAEGYDKSVESPLWHGRALEMAVMFLPSDCPLVNHIQSSYVKHHAPALDSIPEDNELGIDLKVVKSLNGVH